MRYNKVILIIGLLNTFFKRNVLNVGILRNKFFRMMTLAGLIVIIIMLSLIFYKFFDSTDSQLNQTKVILDIYSITVLMWTYIVFLFMKILFMKKETFMNFTQQLPVTKRERCIAILIFEIVISMFVIGLISSSMVISLIAMYGDIFISRIICNIFFMAITWYLLLEVFYSFIVFILDLAKLNKMKNIIVFCIFSAVLIISYTELYPKIIEVLLFNYQDATNTSILIIYAFLMEKYNFIVAIFIFIVVAFIFSILLVCFPVKEKVIKQNFLNIGRSCKNVNLLKSYILNISRRVDTYNYLLICIFLFIYSFILDISKAEYIVLLLSVNGIYSYIQTESLRIIQFQKEYNVIKDYIYLILSQIIYISLVSIPFVLVSFITGNTTMYCLLIYPSIIVSVILFTLAGIIFPPKGENPFTVIIGFIIIFIAFISVLMICFVFNFNTRNMVIVLIATVIFSIYYSIIGMPSELG